MSADIPGTRRGPKLAAILLINIDMRRLIPGTAPRKFGTTTELRPRLWAAALGIALVAAVLALPGCAKKFIPNTTIPDNPYNRKIIKFCEQYRLAVESKDVGKLIMMASSDYYEDGGTPTGSDDFDFSQLRDVLVARFAKVKTIRYDIKYRKVKIEADQIYVDYVWSGSYQLEGALGQDYWFRKVEDNRLILVEYKDTFKIISGM
jgi:hypothetical protein